ncbi:MAG TPA: response regulator [Planctomycetota bacterium]|nr:response regulator [Planctomycetota bacterium]
MATEDAQLRKYVAEALSRAAYSVDGCGGASREILERCGTESPSFLIVDVIPESSTGIDVVRELRARGTSIPVILLSGGPCGESGSVGVEYLSKPFTLEMLELAIDRAFTRVSLEQIPIGGREMAAPRSD